MEKEIQQKVKLEWELLRAIKWSVFSISHNEDQAFDLILYVYQNTIGSW